MIDFEIPIDDAIQRFANHLEANPRTILSSRFGDGKSYFLQKMKKDERISEKYKILTVYPINYQVANNKDIFDLLKHDILFQLILNDMISDQVILKKEELMAWFVQKNLADILSELMLYISEVALDPASASKVIAGFKGLKLFKSLYEKYKAQQPVTEDDRILEFLKNTNSHFVYECDIITKIIQKAVLNYRRLHKKKVVLVIEDMDRIDPAHLFRILNILSAHIDYGSINSEESVISLNGNKFGFDNIVIVLDFKNLHSIYKHFYGQHTCFDGYISKFLTSVPFTYSLEEQKEKYVISKLADLTDVNEDVIRTLLSGEKIKPSTIRDIVQSFEIEKQITNRPSVTIDGQKIMLDTRVLRLIAVMHRLKMNNEEIKEKVLQIKDVNDYVFAKSVLPYIYLMDEGNNDSLSRAIFEQNEHGKRYKVIVLDPKTGTCSYGKTYISYGDKEELTDFGKIVNVMLGFIA